MRSATRPGIGEFGSFLSVILSALDNGVRHPAAIDSAPSIVAQPWRGRGRRIGALAHRQTSRALMEPAKVRSAPQGSWLDWRRTAQPCRSHRLGQGGMTASPWRMAHPVAVLLACQPLSA